MLDVVAAELAVEGPCRRVLEPSAGSSFGDAVVLRFLAGLHELVLDGRAPDLARHFPSAGGEPGPGLASDLLATVARHEVELAASMARPVQTNEVGRSAALLVGYLALGAWGLPLRVLEVGASAGLNLWFDRYRYESGDRAWGPEDSALRFAEPFVGRVPAVASVPGGIPEVVDRRGCDLEPIDPATSAGRLRLRSLVWPDQETRRRRLDDAIEVVRGLGTVVDRADAVDWLGHHLARTERGALTVVTHSIVLQYLPLERRRTLVELIDEAGRRARPDAPVAWLRMEPAGEHAEIRLTTWPDGRAEVVATSGFHGPPVMVVERP